MHRNALYLVAPLTVVLAGGCNFFKKPDLIASSNAAIDPYTSPVVQPEYQPQTFPVYDSPTVTEQMGGTSMPLTSQTFESATRHHLVVRKDTLFSLARMYYSDASRWKDIYRANMSTISDPNKISVGDSLVIP